MTTATSELTSAAGIETYRTIEPADTDQQALSSAFSEDWLPLTEAITLNVDRRLREATWLDDVLNDLREVVALRANWNGGGEQQVHPSSSKRVIGILNHLRSGIPKPHIVPLPNGALQLEWHGACSSIEVEVPAEGPAVGYAFEDDEDDETEWIVARTSRDGNGIAKLSELLANLAA